jgi:hypothetical protein
MNDSNLIVRKSVYHKTYLIERKRKKIKSRDKIGDLSPLKIIYIITLEEVVSCRYFLAGDRIDHIG